MEIGTEISKKIRAAIKGKLQELGAYVDEELPDYIMVMVANKKTSQQMSDDLSLFLGNNTSKFTVWLHGVLEKLRSVAVEPTALRPQLHSDGSVSGKSRASAGEDRRGEESKSLAVSSSRSDKAETRVSSSAHENRRGSSEKNSSRLTSTVKPLMEPLISEAVIDIKPEMDDDLIADDPVVEVSRPRSSAAGRPTAQVYRPPPGRSTSGRSTDAYRSAEAASGRSTDAYRSAEAASGRSTDAYRSAEAAPGRSTDAYRFADAASGRSTDTYRSAEAASGRSTDAYRSAEAASGRSTDAYRSAEGSFHSRQQHSHLQHSGSSSSRPSRNGPSREEASRKRKAPMASSVVRVNQAADEDSDDAEEEDDDDEDEGYGGRSLSSRVSLPTKPERRPTLPPAKQANRNLILKAISEAQDSITKTTSYTATPLPQRQTVPVAPRTRLANSDEMTAAIQLVQDHLQSLAPRPHTYNPTGLPTSRALAPSRSLASRLQLEISENNARKEQHEYRVEVAEGSGSGSASGSGSEAKAFDTRSFIMSRPLLEEPPVRNLLSRPLLEQPSAMNLMTRPLLEEAPIRHLLTRPLLEEAPIRNLLSRPLLEEAPIRHLLSRPLLEEAPIRNLLSRPLLEEAPIRNLLSRPLLEEAPIRNLLSTPLLEEAPIRHLLSSPSHVEPSLRSRLGLQVKGEIQPATPRMVQPSKERGDVVGSASPKFIVTLDGVPSPLGYLADCDMEVDDLRPPLRVTEATVQLNRVGILQRLQGDFSDEDDMDMETSEEDVVPLKRQKVLERCKFWPVCKSGDDCLYHHPKTQCKTFPSCKFGDKCLFVHPNCKYDARCTKPDCPFTHVSRRGAAAPPPKPAMPAPQTGSVCRFFPECKKMDCPFYHPKPCRFAGQCKRGGCTFYHPATTVPPRHALKWTKTQNS